MGFQSIHYFLVCVLLAACGSDDPPESEKAAPAGNFYTCDESAAALCQEHTFKNPPAGGIANAEKYCKEQAHGTWSTTPCSRDGVAGSCRFANGDYLDTLNIYYEGDLWTTQSAAKTCPAAGEFFEGTAP